MLVCQTDMTVLICHFFSPVWDILLFDCLLTVALPKTKYEWCLERKGVYLISGCQLRGIPSSKLTMCFFLLSHLLRVIQSDLRFQLFMFIDLIIVEKE